MICVFSWAIDLVSAFTWVVTPAASVSRDDFCDCRLVAAPEISDARVFAAESTASRSETLVGLASSAVKVL